jgi:hypothetical protein
VTQLAPTGGFFTLGFTGNRTTNNSSFNFVNPSYASGLQLSMNQPLLRNFGRKATNWLDLHRPEHARLVLTRPFVRSAQTVVNNVEQAYWDLV